MNIISNIELSGNLNIRDSDEVFNKLMSSMGTGRDFTVDLNNLTGIDTSIFQVLVAATRSAKELGRQINLQGFDRSPVPDFMRSIGLDPLDIDDRWTRATKPLPPDPNRPERPDTVDTQPEDESSDDLFWLTDKELEALRPFLPAQKGRQRKNDKSVLSGIIQVNENGLKWKDAPRTYGPWKTLYSRWKRWQDTGVFEEMRTEIRSKFPENESLIKLVDSLTKNNSKNKIHLTMR